jgi:hypothetical protein
MGVSCVSEATAESKPERVGEVEGKIRRFEAGQRECMKGDVSPRSPIYSRTTLGPFSERALEFGPPVINSG